MFLTENMLAKWVLTQKGLLITRSIHNLKTFNFQNNLKINFVCITGYKDLLYSFFDEIIYKFYGSVILIIIESDIIFLKSIWLDNSKLKHCFTWNKPFHHPKLTCIPIGLNYQRQYNGIMTWLKNNENIDIEKKLLCINFSLSTNSERKLLDNYISSKWNFCEKIGYIEPSNKYMAPSFTDGKIEITITNTKCYDEWSKYKFVLSPRGAGEDCHRTWEAVIVGCIPIVKSSTINEIYNDLPIVVVDSWSTISEEFLNRKYVEFKSNKNFNLDKLNLEYWTAIMKNKIID